MKTKLFSSAILKCSFRTLSTLILIGISLTSKAQITVTGGYTAAQMAAKLAGPGVTVFGATLNCPSNAYGEFVVTASTLGLDSGLVLTNGTAITTAAAVGVNGAASLFASTGNGAPGDADLTTLAGLPTFDACVLEFNFKPAGDTIRFKYVFGSEEYTDFTCTTFNDVFGFLISGGAYTTPTNLALVPGTSIPVCINSVNCGATGSGSLATCTSLGTGSPFCAYYVNNSAGTTVTYDGTTVVMTAIAIVSPCDTYHLKLGVADASDDVLDSGVFLEAGSLTSRPPVTISGVGVSGLPYCVAGCAPGTFQFTIPVAQDTPIIVNYVIGGTAVNGVDYVTIPTSTVIPPFTTSAVIVINPLASGTSSSVVSVNIMIPDPCHPGVFTIGATASLTILDTFAFSIVTPDTPICSGQHVNAVALGDPNIGSLLTYTWSPAASVTGVNSLTPTMTPTVTTTYTLTASLPAVIGCAPESHSFTIKVFDRPILTTDSPLVKICLGTPAPLHVYAFPDTIDNQYLWTPSTYLNNDTIWNPLSTPTVPGDITYTVTVNPREVPGCSSTDTIRVHIYPNSISVHPADTMVCRGAVVQAIGSGDPAFHYQWLPTAGIPISNTMSTTISPDTTALYTLTATFPGCPVMTATLFLDVQPNPVVYAGGSRFECQFDTIHITADVQPHWYSHYSYHWSPGAFLDDSTAATVVYTGNATTKLYVDVTTPAGCKAKDSVTVTFVPGNFVASIPDKNICPHDTFTVVPDAPAGTTFEWFPSLYVSDSVGATPLLSPIADVTYTVLAISPGGCKDTAVFTVKVHEAGVIFLGDSVTLYPGDTYQFQPQTNCVSMAWFPPQGLNDPFASNPIASPEIGTQYVVQGVTEWGCKASDSVTVYVDNESVIALPNAFTPGNGPNSEFKIIKKGLATLNYFRIFNRWGNLVFETTNIDEGWNGMWKDKPQPFGVYIYEVQAVTSTGRIINKGGNITLIR